VFLVTLQNLVEIYAVVLILPDITRYVGYNIGLMPTDATE